MSSLQTPPRRDLKGQAAIARMAADMIAEAGSHGAATRDDLVRRGWKRQQLDVHGEAAREMAQSRSGDTFN